MKSTYYVASSLDGYIADLAGGVEWLDEVDIDQEAGGYEAFYAGIDGLAMGRATYDFIFDYGEWPYDNKPCWICSTRDLVVLPGCNRQAATDPAAVFAEAEAQGLQNLWVVGGGKLASTLIMQGLLTHIHVTLMPVILGEGISLFDRLPAAAFLTQESGEFKGGATDLVYRVQSKSNPKR